MSRANKAVQLHPTDFALLSTGAEQLPQLLQLLHHVPGFRDVHPDRRIQGVSNWQPEGPLAAAFSDASLQQQQTQKQQQQQAQTQTHPALRQPAGALKLVQEVAAMPSKQLLADAPVDGSSQQGDPGGSSQQAAQQQQPQPPAEQAGVQPLTAATGDADGGGDDDSIWSVGKPPGRMSTAHTIGLDPKSKADRDAGYNKDELRRKSRRRGLLSWASGLWSGGSSSSSGRLLQQTDTRVTHLLEAPVLWKQGFSGKGIKVGCWDACVPLTVWLAEWWAATRVAAHEMEASRPEALCGREGGPCRAPCAMLTCCGVLWRAVAARLVCLTLASVRATHTSATSRSAPTGRTRTAWQTGWATAALWRA